MDLISAEIPTFLLTFESLKFFKSVLKFLIAVISFFLISHQFHSFYSTCCLRLTPSHFGLSFYFTWCFLLNTLLSLIAFGYSALLSSFSPPIFLVNFMNSYSNYRSFSYSNYNSYLKTGFSTNSSSQIICRWEGGFRGFGGSCINEPHPSCTFSSLSVYVVLRKHRQIYTFFI